MKILVTGCAGFIGSNLCDRLIKDGHIVIGVDNFNDYYNPAIKERNLEAANKNRRFRLCREDILNFEKLKEIFKKESPDKIVHLAARAGVRPSLKDPLLYAQVNVLGTVNLLKLSVEFDVKQFIFGSSSSVYGNSKKVPFSEDDPCNAIVSPYAASKRSAEFFVESFYRIYGLKSLILRFFTVYGPRGRPDMAPALFARAIYQHKSIIQFGDGLTGRDYTYIDDVIDGIEKALMVGLDFEVINLGGNKTTSLVEFINTLEKVCRQKAIVDKYPQQPGDVEKTWANVVKAKKLLNWAPKISLVTGLSGYVEWLKKKN